MREKLLEEKGSVGFFEAGIVLPAMMLFAYAFLVLALLLGGEIRAESKGRREALKEEEKGAETSLRGTFFVEKTAEHAFQGDPGSIAWNGERPDWSSVRKRVYRAADPARLLTDLKSIRDFVRTLRERGKGK